MASDEEGDIARVREGQVIVTRQRIPTSELWVEMWADYKLALKASVSAGVGRCLYRGLVKPKDFRFYALRVVRGFPYSPSDGATILEVCLMSKIESGLTFPKNCQVRVVTAVEAGALLIRTPMGLVLAIGIARELCEYLMEQIPLVLAELALDDEAGG